MLLLEVFTPYRHHGDPGAQDQNLESDDLGHLGSPLCGSERSSVAPVTRLFTKTGREQLLMNLYVVVCGPDVVLV